MRHIKRLRLLSIIVATLLAATLAAVLHPASSSAAGSFYSYTGNRPLSSYSPGDVLKTRTVPYHYLNLPTPINALQILYRSTNATGQPVANVTTVFQPVIRSGPSKVISYQSYYDSLNPEDSPSRAVAGDAPLLGFEPVKGDILKSDLLAHVRDGQLLTSSETVNIAPLLLAGFTINVPDTEGQQAHFAAGPEYGMLTLDSLRAARNVAKTGITDTTKIGLLGYSGGAIASTWTAIKAPSYAPDINKNLVGVSEGGVLANPANTLKYAQGSFAWAGVVGLAVVGISRAYNVNFDKYLSPYGKSVMSRLHSASITNAYLQAPGLTWRQMMKKKYANPNSVPEFVDIVNKINMGLADLPQTPFFIAQGSLGILEGTLPGPRGIGDGDGVMIAGDVRALANRYCNAGLRVHYDQYNTLSHIPGGALWYPGALLWLLDRFAGHPAPSNCGHIPAGNAIAAQRFIGN